MIKDTVDLSGPEAVTTFGQTGLVDLSAGTSINWILASGSWDDTKLWDDTQPWKDS